MLGAGSKTPELRNWADGFGRRIVDKCGASRVESRDSSRLESNEIGQIWKRNVMRRDAVRRSRVQMAAQSNIRAAEARATAAKYRRGAQAAQRTIEEGQAWTSDFEPISAPEHEKETATKSKRASHHHHHGSAHRGRKSGKSCVIRPVHFVSFSILFSIFDFTFWLPERRREEGEAHCSRFKFSICTCSCRPRDFTDKVSSSARETSNPESVQIRQCTARAFLRIYYRSASLTE